MGLLILILLSTLFGPGITPHLSDVDLISRGAQGHGPVHLLLTSAAELGFAWDGDEKGWVRVSPPLLFV